MIDFCSVEIGLLNSINYEMEFDIPLKYREPFFNNYLLKLRSEMLECEPRAVEIVKRVFRIFDEITNRFVKDSYLRDFCLYFPGPVIYAACLLIADRVINSVFVSVPVDQNNQEK